NIKAVIFFNDDFKMADFTLTTNMNAVLIMLTGSLVSGFVVDNFWWALLFGLALSVINTFLRKISR
ncbi:MAG: phage holin family protein, partial [Firmicutes bacterium]|nr:phage holin family protein [Bacillota bacterium]